MKERTDLILDGQRGFILAEQLGGVRAMFAPVAEASLPVRQVLDQASPTGPTPTDFVRLTIHPAWKRILKNNEKLISILFLFNWLPYVKS